MSEYTREVSVYETNLWLSPTEVDFLERISKHPCSTYNIYLELKRPTIVERDDSIHPEDIKVLSRTDPERLGKGIAYKNVLTRIQRLLKFHLIKEITISEQKNPHNAKVYEITSKGIFYLIHFRLFLLRTGDLTQYHGDVILETILFPYFEDSTLRRYTIHFKSIMSLYLSECCEITLTEVKRIQGETNRGEKQRLANLLMDELKGAAKSMAVKFFNVGNSRPERKAKQEQESAFSFPRGDKKFEKLTIELKQDVDQWFARDISKS
jgi:hypothetical protein